MAKQRLHFVQLGPAIPVVPVTDFTRFKDMGITQQMFEEAWKIVGPSVERNIRIPLEPWELYTACYLEGLAHGSQMATEMAEAKAKAERTSTNTSTNTNAYSNTIHGDSRGRSQW